MTRRSALIRAICVPLVLACAPAASTAYPPGDLAADPLSDSALVRVESLAVRAGFLPASQEATELLAARRLNAHSLPYQIAEAEKLVAVLDRAAALPEQDRADLARAARDLESVQGLASEARYEEMEKCIQHHLDLVRRLIGNDNIWTADDLSQIASTRIYSWRHAEAEPFALEALSMRRKLFGDAHPLVADDLNRLAQVRFHKGDPAGGERTICEAIALRAKIFGKGHARSIYDLYVLGLILVARGDLAKAEPVLRECLAISRNHLGSEHLSVAGGLLNLAVVLGARGDHVSAESLCREGLEIYRKVLGDKHPFTASALDKLSSELTDLGDYDQAEALAREATAIWRVASGDDHPKVALGLTRVGYLRQLAGDLVGAERLCRESLAMRERLGQSEHPESAVCRRLLGSILAERGDFSSAEAAYLDAAAVQRRMLGDKDPSLVKTCLMLGKLYAANGRQEAALEWLEEGARIFDAARLRVDPGVGRSEFLDSPYPDLATTRLALGRKGDAWQAAEKALGRSLADLLRGAGGRNLVGAEAAAEDSLLQLLSHLEQTLEAQRKALESDSTGDARLRFEDCRNRLLNAEVAWDTHRLSLAEKHPVTEGEAYSLQRIQAVLSERTALIGWVDVETARGAWSSWGYVIREGGPVQWAEIGPRGPGAGTASPRLRIRRLRDLLATAGLSPLGPPSSQDWMEEARRIWQERIAPLSRAIEGIDDLVVIPSGAVLGLPVEMLVDTENAFLGDRYAVSYAPSATVYAWLAEQKARNEAHGAATALFVGDPVLSGSSSSLGDLAEHRTTYPPLLTSAAPGTRAETFLVRSALTGDEKAIALLPRLRWSGEEVRSSAAVFGNKAIVLTGTAATEQNLVRLSRSGSLSRMGTIHIATHALIDNEQPEQSAMVLSRSGLPDRVEAVIAGERIYDGLLTPKEVVREWKLDADLVTLSGCETALGKEVTGEGHVGFTHAFLQAGARSLLLSLWKVDDEATALLMRRFYENWTGTYEDERAGRPGEAMPKGEALREAKAWLRTYRGAGGRQAFGHPYYWSAFVLFGSSE